MNKADIGIRYFKYSTFSAVEKSLYYSRVYKFLRRLAIEYPGFSKWYKNLFQENKELHKDREIIICEKEYSIAGIAILKSSEAEKKICTLRVDKCFQRQGIGKQLMEMSFEWLENDKPLITMHKSKQIEFASLLDYYGFSLEQTQWNYYNIFSTELSYNGILPERKIVINNPKFINTEPIYRWIVYSGKYNSENIIEEYILRWYEKRQISEGF